jgi:asparagine synthetase A
MYPTLTDKEREYEITKKHKTVFIMQIGDVQASYWDKQTLKLCEKLGIELL